MDLIVDTSRKGIRMFVCGVNAANENVERELVKTDARSEKLENLLDELLSSVNAALENVKRVLVLCGPGSFTGLRTGIAFCEGLCFSGKRELYGVSSLKAFTTFANSTPVVITKARPGFWYYSENTENSGEYFWSTEQVVKALANVTATEAVLDDNAVACADIANAIAAKNIAVVKESEGSLASLRKVFDWGIKPSPVQDANYIQPSYAEQ